MLALQSPLKSKKGKHGDPCIHLELATQQPYDIQLQT
jgi:hypothetical protein